MDERALIICDAVADWAEHVHAEILKKEVDPAADRAIERATQKASSAFANLKKIDPIKNALQFEESKETFFDGAADFFRIRADRSRSFVRYRMFLIFQHEEKWAKLSRSLESCRSYSEAIECLARAPVSGEEIESVSQAKGRNLADFKRELNSKLANLKELDFRRRFGAEQVYAELGKEAALKYFEEQQPKSRGRKPGQSLNPDVGRAFEFSHVIEVVAERLDQHRMKAASSHELCSVMFGPGSDARIYDRAGKIKWLLNNHLNAANITAQAFLNSISRGRASFYSFMVQMGGADPSQLK